MRTKPRSNLSRVIARHRLSLMGSLAVLGSLTVSASAQAHGGADRPHLHVGYAYKSCYIDLHPELTSGQLRTFSREFADAGAFVPMAGAQPLAPWSIGIGLTYNQTFIDDTKPQWNNTFSHPGDDHWLGRPALPIIQTRLGLPRAFEAELMLTGDPNSNWALVGAALRTSLVSETKGAPASVTARLTYLHLLGVDELDLDAASLEGLTSRTFGRFTPYASLGAVVSRGAEHTSELAFGSRTALGARATAGLEVALWRFRLAAQAMWASVPSLGVMLGGVI
jgi:hypothetical protein